MMKKDLKKTMTNMKNYLKRLNWYGLVLTFALTGAAAFSRDQDPSLLVSFYVWMILGLPLSTLFLFIGMKSKEEE